MDRNLHSQSDAGEEAARQPGDTLSQEGLLQAVLAAIRECRPEKCVVLEAQHLPDEVPGFATHTV